MYLYRFRDDHLLMKWNLVTGDSQKVCELPNDVFPLDFHSFSRNTGGRKQAQEQLLITSTDGEGSWILCRKYKIKHYFYLKCRSLPPQVCMFNLSFYKSVTWWGLTILGHFEP